MILPNKQEKWWQKYLKMIIVTPINLLQTPAPAQAHHTLPPATWNKIEASNHHLVPGSSFIQPHPDLTSLIWFSWSWIWFDTIWLMRWCVLRCDLFDDVSSKYTRSWLSSVQAFCSLIGWSESRDTNPRFWLVDEVSQLWCGTAGVQVIAETIFNQFHEKSGRQTVHWLLMCWSENYFIL